MKMETNGFSLEILAEAAMIFVASTELSEDRVSKDSVDDHISKTSKLGLQIHLGTANIPKRMRSMRRRKNPSFLVKKEEGENWPFKKHKQHSNFQVDLELRVAIGSSCSSFSKMDVLAAVATATLADNRENCMKKNPQLPMVKDYVESSKSPMQEFAETPIFVDTRLPFMGVSIPNQKRSLIREKKVKVQGMDFVKHSLKRCCEFQSCNEDDAERLKKQKTNGGLDVGFVPESDLPVEFKNQIRGMRGYDVKLVIQKKLYKSDVEENNGRFSIPLKQLRSPFLTQPEINSLENPQAPGISVRLVEPCLDETVVYLKKWKMGNCFTYNLITNWNSVVKNLKNGLEIGVEVQLWAFRVESHLCFALVNLSRTKVGVIAKQDDGDCVASYQPGEPESSCCSSVTHELC